MHYDPATREGGVVTIAGATCRTKSWTHERVVCEVDGAISTGGVVDVTIKYDENSRTSNTVQFSYSIPTISGVAPLVAGTAQTDPPTVMTITGTDLGSGGATVLIDGRFECPVRYHSPTQIRCNVPEGQGTGLAINLIYRGQLVNTSSSLRFSYNAPTLMAMTKAGANVSDAFATDGGLPVILTGQDLGAYGSLYFGDVLANAYVDSWSHNEIRARTPPGVGKDIGVRVSTASGSATVPFSYEPPTVVKVSPNPFDAMGGELLTLEGTNFGANAGANGSISITIGGNDCPNAAWSRASVAVAPVLTCVAPASIANVELNVSIVVSGNRERSSVSVATTCGPGYFKSSDDQCKICPVGAYCLGGDHYPRSMPGWWRTCMTNPTGVECVGRGFVFNKCIPAQGCTGNNTCAPGYSGEMCNTCNDQYHRSTATRECLTCNGTTHSVLNFSGMIAGFILVFIVVYYLTKWDYKVTALSICFDFCQMVAIIGTIKLNWPTAAKYLFEWAELFNLDFGLGNPECVVGHTYWNFPVKMLVTQFTPVITYFAFYSFYATYRGFGSLYALCSRLTDDGDNEGKISTAIDAGPEHLDIKHDDGTMLTEEEIKKRFPGMSEAQIRDKLKGFGKEMRDRTWDIIFGCWNLIFFYQYQTTVRVAMTPFVCTSLNSVQSSTFGNTSTLTPYTLRVMEVEPSIICDLTAGDWVYPFLFGLAVVSTIFYAIVIPVLFALSLYSNKEGITSDLRKREAGIDVEGKSVNMANAALKVQAAFRGVMTRKAFGTDGFYKRKQTPTSTINVRTLFSRIFEDYTSAQYTWRMHIMLRKVALVGIVYLASYPSFQAACVLTIVFTYFYLTGSLKPFMDRFPGDSAYSKPSEHNTKKSKRHGREKKMKRKAVMTAASSAAARKSSASGMKKAQGGMMSLFGGGGKVVPAGGAAAGAAPIAEGGVMSLMFTKNKKKAGEEGKTNTIWKAEKVQTRAEIDKMKVGKQKSQALARHRWRKAIMVSKPVTRWEKQTWPEYVDDLAWLFEFNSLEMYSLAAVVFIICFGLIFAAISNMEETIVDSIYGVRTFEVTGFIQPENWKGTAASVTGAVIVTLFVMVNLVLLISLFVDLYRNLEKQWSEMANTSLLDAMQDANDQAVEAWERKVTQHLDIIFDRMDKDFDKKIKKIMEDHERDVGKLQGLMDRLKEEKTRLEKRLPATKNKAGLVADIGKIERELTRLEMDKKGLTRTLRQKTRDMRRELGDQKRRRRNKLEGRMKARRDKRLQKKSGFAPRMIRATKLQMKVLIARRMFGSLAEKVQKMRMQEDSLKKRLGLSKKSFDLGKERELIKKINSSQDKHDSKIAKLMDNQIRVEEEHKAVKAHIGDLDKEIGDLVSRRESSRVRGGAQRRACAPALVEFLALLCSALL